MPCEPRRERRAIHSSRSGRLARLGASRWTVCKVNPRAGPFHSGAPSGVDAADPPFQAWAFHGEYASSTELARQNRSASWTSSNARSQACFAATWSRKSWDSYRTCPTSMPAKLGCERPRIVLSLPPESAPKRPLAWES